MRETVKLIYKPGSCIKHFGLPSVQTRGLRRNALLGNWVPATWPKRPAPRHASGSKPRTAAGSMNLDRFLGIARTTGGEPAGRGASLTSLLVPVDCAKQKITHYLPPYAVARREQRPAWIAPGPAYLRPQNLRQPADSRSANRLHEMPKAASSDGECGCVQLRIRRFCPPHRPPWELSLMNRGSWNTTANPTALVSPQPSGGRRLCVREYARSSGQAVAALCAAALKNCATGAGAHAIADNRGSSTFAHRVGHFGNRHR